MNTQATGADGKRPASGDAGDAAKSAAASELSQQQQLLLQQQLQQQQLQLLQLQQQQLQNMSPSDMAAMTQQLALFMMPMMPFMMPLQQQAAAALAAAASGDASQTTTAAPATATVAAAAATPATSASTTFQPTTDSLNMTAPAVGSEGYNILGGAFGTALAPPATEEPQKRKRGRPPKKDVAARAKADAEKALKQQFPMFGYGLPLPLLPGFPGMLAPGVNSATKDGTTQPMEEQAGKDEEGELTYDKNGRATSGRPTKVAKKKPRGTGKPRGRPRTRPRPGEIIRRAKPAAIAPANYSVMYNYSLSNLAQKSSELNPEGGATAGTGAAVTNASAHDDSRLAPLGASLLSGEHE